MQIVFLTDHLVRAGAEMQLARIATTLASRGWAVGVITMLPSVAYLEDLKANNVPVYQCADGIPRFRWLPLRMATRMIRRLRLWRPAILITFNYHPDILGRLCGRMAGVKGIVSALGTAKVKTPHRARMYRWTEWLIDLTVSNSLAALRYMSARKVLTPAKTTVIYNGMITTRYPDPAPREAVRAELGFQEGDFVWLAVGNLLPAKDYPTLLEAAGRCLAQMPSFRLVVAGGGEELETLRARAAQGGLDGRVSFLGLRTDVPRLLRACDAYVLSSAWEGMPNAVMEAMASEVPVVSTDAGGVNELVEHGVSGYITPCADPDALAARMLEVMRMDPDHRRGMGLAGRQRILQAFENERVVDHWEAVIRQVVETKAGPRALCDLPPGGGRTGEGRPAPVAAPLEREP
jgi:glycosyltransferase involved in cell wall biosynthesis